MTMIRAHFDGKAFVPDEPVPFRVNQAVTLHVDAAQDQQAILMSKKEARRQMCESIRRSIPPGVSLSEELMAERKQEAANE